MGISEGFEQGKLVTALPELNMLHINKIQAGQL